MDLIECAPEHLRQERSPQRDSAEVALEIVSETAAAIRLLEEQSVQAVARTQELARSAVEKLELADARVEHLEAQTAQLSEELSWNSRTASDDAGAPGGERNRARGGKRQNLLHRKSSCCSRAARDRSKRVNRTHRSGHSDAASWSRAHDRAAIAPTGGERSTSSLRATDRRSS